MHLGPSWGLRVSGCVMFHPHALPSYLCVPAHRPVLIGLAGGGGGSSSWPLERPSALTALAAAGKAVDLLAPLGTVRVAVSHSGGCRQQLEWSGSRGSVPTPYTEPQGLDLSSSQMCGYQRQPLPCTPAPTYIQQAHEHPPAESYIPLGFTRTACMPAPCSVALGKPQACSLA